MIAASKHGEDLLGASGQRRLLFGAQAAERGQGETHASTGLVIVGICEAYETHLLEHASDALPSLLGDPEIGAHARDSRVARVPRDVQRVGGIRKPGEAAGALDLDARGEDAHADVVPCHRVAAMHDGIDQALQPSILRNEGLVGESPAGAEGAALRDPRLYTRSRIVDDAGDRTFEAHIHAGLDSLSAAGPGDVIAETGDADMRLWKPVLRALAEQEDGGLCERAVPAEQTPRLKRGAIVGGCADRLAILGEFVDVQVLDVGVDCRFVFELCAAAVVIELATLRVGELLRFVTEC